MNNRNKKILVAVIVLQLLLLVIPAGVKAADQYIKEKNAPEKGESFTFVASNVWYNDEMLCLYARLAEDYYEYVPTYKKLQLFSDENGYATAREYKGENDFYVYGKYISLDIPFEKIKFSDGYDFERLGVMLDERENKESWYFGEDAWDESDSEDFYEAAFTAVVYKGVIIPEAFYIDGVEILRVEG